MRPILFLIALLLALPAEALVARAAPQPVDVALVLVSDVSLSITESEYALEKQGYSTAIASPAVVTAIRHGAIGAIALSYVEFAGPDQVATIVRWHVIHDQASARQFAASLLAAPRSAMGRTAVGSGIAAATQDLAESGFAATRRIIDVCGDGNSNTGIPLAVARAAALNAGITINGLAIIHPNPPPWLVPHVAPPGGIVKYYHDNVIGGPGSFVTQVNTDQDFTAAMTHKLILEIASRRATGL
ncbi:MAG: DUF1194 domain-containing protein [Acetobacteraceae bacterium]